MLDEKEVNIDVLRENVRTYQDLERTLESVRRRMEKLEQIEKFHDEAADHIRKDEMYIYFLARASLDITLNQIEKLQAEKSAEEYRLRETEKDLNAAVREKERQQEIETNLRVELKQNKDFLALEEQNKVLDHLKEQEKACLDEKRALLFSVKKSLKKAALLLEIKDTDKCVSDYKNIFENIESLEDISAAKEVLEHLIRYKKKMYEKVQRKMAEAQIHLHTRQQEMQELDHKISNLERKKLSYPEAVTRLLQEIGKEFARLGRRAEPCVLCEALEMKDESWRNAVEGYLNTQRFYVLVEPENFDIALGIYDRLRREKKAYGAGLINARNMEKYDETPDGTLASVVTSKNKYARQYINMVLGKVQMCSRYEDLKKYPVSITKECMKYQNRVASAIRPEIFRVPFIGKNAFKVQLEQARKEKELLAGEIGRIENRLKDLEQVTGPLATDDEVDIRYRLDVIGRLSRVQMDMKQCRENIRTLKQNSTLIQKQIQLEALARIREELEQKVGNLNKSHGRIQEKIEEKERMIRESREEERHKAAELAGIEEKSGQEIALWQKDYEKQTSQKSYTQFRDNFERRQKANWTLRDKALEQMQNHMIEYKTEYNFGAAPNMQGFPEFEAVYERLRTSELLDYEEKVQSARKAAEDEFREQFLAKLQENMKQAQNEFKELNKALKDIVFSNEKYEFLYMPSRRHRRYYEMIMDDFNMVQGESIFSGVFHETHKEVIEELFDRLTIDNDNNAKTLDEFTDYRTYMDYDIRILHTDGSYSLYSKVCEEKSGGETQTPFYVTVAASFVQLYSNNIGGEAAGLVMFDEAFNNMDDERIGGVLEFLNRLPLQLIIAAPPDKIQYISPSMQETLLVMTDEKISYVEEYYNGAV